jgi:formylglycine-generating enzyme required for sulfatase activity
VKQILPFLLLVCLADSSIAQNIFYCGYGEAVLPTDICNVVKANAFANNEEAEVAIDKILKQLGLPRNFAIAQCPDIENCVAYTADNGTRYIVYDKVFIQRIKNQTSDWAALSILAHEIGHHLSGHPSKGYKNLAESRKFELEADYFCGYQMYRLGASLSQAQQAVRLVASERDDTFSDHPKLSKRLEAIKNGYNKAKTGNGGGKDEPVDLPAMEFVKGGSFDMGSYDGEGDEQPVHKVFLSDFYIGIHEVTFDEYDAFCDATGKPRPDDEGWGRGRWPVINISWYDAVAYCNWLSVQDELQEVYSINGREVEANWKANGYRLPTEAEWEFASRSRGENDKWAGTSSEGKLSYYSNFNDVNGIGNWKTENQNDGHPFTAPVGSFRPNYLGIYDMSGNVNEWCWDFYDDAQYYHSKRKDPLGWGSGNERSTRGGSWISSPKYLRCSARGFDEPAFWSRFLGFRLARSAR